MVNIVQIHKRISSQTTTWSTIKRQIFILLHCNGFNVSESLSNATYTHSKMRRRKNLQQQQWKSQWCVCALQSESSYARKRWIETAHSTILLFSLIPLNPLSVQQISFIRSLVDCEWCVRARQRHPKSRLLCHATFKSKTVTQFPFRNWISCKAIVILSLCKCASVARFLENVFRNLIRCSANYSKISISFAVSLLRIWMPFQPKMSH